MRGASFPGVALLAVVVGCAEPHALRLAATSTIENSGLLPVILPAFTRETGIEVEAVIGGTGRSLDLLDRGDVDAAFTHDPEAEKVRVDRGDLAVYRKVMYNDFVIAGPAADPSGVRSASSGIDAMARIAAGTATFVSRADSSGTHSRELLLWKLAGRGIDATRRLETGQGMSATLRVASERQAYTLTDRATFRQLEPTLKLSILFEGDPRLLNTYAVMYGTRLGESKRALAQRLVDFLADGNGRQVIANYQIRGQSGFLPWPVDARRDHPDALPHAR